jgi:hypothetical protein
MKPQYGEHDRAYRIAYMSNGLWQLQHFSGKNGVNAIEAANPKDCRDHYDPWEAMNRPTSLEVAKTQLASRNRIAGMAS